MSTGLLEPIPWSYTDTPGVLQWTWVTEHFTASITGAEAVDVDAAFTEGLDEQARRRLVRSFSWDVSDLMRTHQGLPRLLVEGVAGSFDEAESTVREHVGKLYDSRLGYARYSGPLAFTFTLSNGKRVNVSKFMGTRCSVTVLMPDRSEQTVTGDFDVQHYAWRLRTADQMLEIVPEHVLSITNRSEAATRASAITRPDSYSGIGRIYREDPKPGCTGRPGFSMGTVDHAGCPQCPLHEEGLPEYLLK